MPQTLVKETSDTPLPLAESVMAAGSGRVFSPVNITQLDTDEEEEEASFKSSSGRSKADSQCRIRRIPTSGGKSNYVD